METSAGEGVVPKPRKPRVDFIQESQELLKWMVNPSKFLDHERKHVLVRCLLADVTRSHMWGGCLHVTRIPSVAHTVVREYFVNFMRVCGVDATQFPFSPTKTSGMLHLPSHKMAQQHPPSRLRPRPSPSPGRPLPTLQPMVWGKTATLRVSKAILPPNSCRTCHLTFFDQMTLACFPNCSNSIAKPVKKKPCGTMGQGSCWGYICMIVWWYLRLLLCAVMELVSPQATFHKFAARREWVPDQCACILVSN
jgi:hypothetical protein